MARTKVPSGRTGVIKEKKVRTAREPRSVTSLSDEEKRVRELWADITSYWEREAGESSATWNSPIGEEAFADIEDKIGFPLPNDFKEFYRIHDGQNEDGYEHPLFGGAEICCTPLAEGIDNNLFEDETCTDADFPEEGFEAIMKLERERDPELEVLYDPSLLKKRSLDSGEAQEGVKPQTRPLPTIENSRKRFEKTNEFNKWNYLGGFIFGYAEQEEGSHGYCLMGFSLKQDPTVYAYEIGFWHFQEARPYSIIPFDAGSNYPKLFPWEFPLYYQLSHPNPFRFLEWLENYVHYLNSQKLEEHRPDDEDEEEDEDNECIIYGDVFHLECQRQSLQKSARK